MKKLITLILIFTLTLTLFCACSSSEKEEPPKKEAETNEGETLKYVDTGFSYCSGKVYFISPTWSSVIESYDVESGECEEVYSDPNVTYNADGSFSYEKLYAEFGSICACEAGGELILIATGYERFDPEDGQDDSYFIKLINVDRNEERDLYTDSSAHPSQIMTYGDLLIYEPYGEYEHSEYFIYDMASDGEPEKLDLIGKDAKGVFISCIVDGKIYVGADDSEVYEYDIASKESRLIDEMCEYPCMVKDGKLFYLLFEDEGDSTPDLMVEELDTGKATLLLENTGGCVGGQINDMLTGGKIYMLIPGGSKGYDGLSGVDPATNEITQIIDGEEYCVSWVKSVTDKYVVFSGTDAGSTDLTTSRAIVFNREDGTYTEVKCAN